MTVYSRVLDIGYSRWHSFQDRIRDPKAQRRLVLVIVCIALLLDNMLYMVIVPIIPNFLTLQKEQQEDMKYQYRYYNMTHSGNVSNDVTHGYVLAHKLNPSGQFKNGEIVNVPQDAVLAINNTFHPDHHPDNRIYLLKIPVPPPPISYGDEGLAIGVLFASKAICQLFVNPFTGGLIDRIGYDVPMMIGLTIMFFSTSVFALGESYAVLFLARSLQGVGSAFADTSGLAMIADRFTEEGFLWLNILIFMTNVMYAPLLIFLRNIYVYKPFDNDNELLIDDPPPKSYNTYVQNGGLHGKPEILDNADNFASHLKISNRKSNEIDCYPPPTEPEYVYSKDTSYNFYNQFQ
ncbi:unnamed protein product [Candidula unifasciata]|uniref:Major facilitator superfamily (MFS) profile domain-containing protein n=1 Tax=Candidula unifasciata TaxID=100452 RepID=A0A8S3ZC56_9EUPU|nr:unnamed protein product [Candidula unifasciata]